MAKTPNGPKSPRMPRAPMRPKEKAPVPPAAPAPSTAAAEAAAPAAAAPPPAEAGGLRRRGPYPLRGGQAQRPPHRRTPEDDGGPAPRHRQERERGRLRGPEEAGPGVPDPEEPRPVVRPDVRRRRAGGPARRVRVPAVAGLQLHAVAGRHLRLARARSGGSACGPGTSSPARSARPRTTSGTSPCSRSRPSTTTTPRACPRRSSSRT